MSQGTGRVISRVRVRAIVRVRVRLIGRRDDDGETQNNAYSTCL